MNLDIEPQLREFIANNLLFSGEECSLSDDASLLANGVIDSAGIMELVEFVSGQFDLEIPMKDIHQDNFDSIGRLANYIRRRHAVAAVSQPGQPGETQSGRRTA